MKLPKLAAAALLLCFAPQPRAQQQAPAPEVKQVYWEPGKECCDEVYVDGVRIRYLTESGVTVALFVLDVDGFYAAAVEVENRTGGRVLVNPDRTRLMAFAKDEKDDFALRPLDPDKVAKKIAGRAKWGNFWRSFAAGMATRGSTSRTQESGSVSVYGPRGSATGTYNGASTTTTSSPDYAARERAAEANARANDSARGEAAVARDNALRTTTLFPDRLVNGFVFFERKKMEKAVFRIEVGATVFNFPVRFK